MADDSGTDEPPMDSSSIRSPGMPEEIERAERMVLDQLTERLDSLKLLRRTDEAKASALLEEFGATGKVESEMLAELSAWKPLYRPDRFAQAHRTAIRALEVFDRNAARPANLKRLGPLRPIASFVVQLFTRMIVRSYQHSVIDSIRHLYGRREANAPTGTPEYATLRIARVQAERLAPGFKKNGLGLPTFLLGGAFISSIVSSLQSVGTSALHNNRLLLAVSVALALVALGVSWCILTAAGTARRRVRITLQQPLAALWETIGAAGHPPKDQSRQFALYSIGLLVVGWLVVPLALILRT